MFWLDYWHETHNCSTKSICTKSTSITSRKKIDHEVIIDVPWNKNTLTKDKNPLGKVPILITKAKQHIFDSKVIIRYLDQIVPNPKLYPSDHKNELSTLTIEAIAELLTFLLLQA